MRFIDNKGCYNCPQRFDGITIDPKPDWKFDDILSELNSLQIKLHLSAPKFAKTGPRDFSNTSCKPFTMRVSVDENDDDTESESTFENQCSYLMDEEGIVGTALHELSHENHLQVKEEIRNKISALETDLREKYTSALTQVERYREARCEMDRRFDTQYQRKIAEALDNHLTTVQQDHELRSQIEERKIRSDVAYEEAKRKEKAFHEEKLRQEKAKAESEARLGVEEAKRAALEAERRAAKEVAERLASETSTRVVARVAQEYAGLQMNANAGTSSKVLWAAESALNFEQARLHKFKEVDERNQALRLTYNKANVIIYYSPRYHYFMKRSINQIRRSTKVVSEKACEIVKIFHDPHCPQSVSMAAFAQKVLSYCISPDNDAFACAYVIVLVTSQVPHTMDLLLAELHRACIYTVPKHITYSELAFECKGAYYKVLGYKESDGKLESTKDYLRRLESYMKLYGALVQTEVQGFQNTHGLKEGWAWIARFLNTLPVNRDTAVALSAFLKMAGFALFKKYKTQFIKVLSYIWNNFLQELKACEDPAREDLKLSATIRDIQNYMEDKLFLKEPEGRALMGGVLLSDVFLARSNGWRFGMFHMATTKGVFGSAPAVLSNVILLEQAFVLGSPV
uniref:mRNA export factor GLE1 n=1 Tax=Quercus lobata TaxID=97700 RepID=A0A7N2L8A1_QUELO